MKSKTVIILLGAAVVVGAAALLIDRAGRPPEAPDATTSKLLLTELKDKVNDVASITVKRPGAEFTMKRTGDTWGLQEKGGYPVQLEQVKGAVVGLSQLRSPEPRTTNPALYEKIGVQDPGAKAPDPPPPPTSPDEPPPQQPAQPTLVTLKNDKGDVLASVIVGTQKWGNPPSVYVRKAGETQSWLAEGKVEVPTDIMQWVERQVLNIGRERIKSVTVTHSDGTTLEASREKSTDANFLVKGIPPGRELTAPTAAESIATGIQYLYVDDVAPAAEVDFNAAAPTPPPASADGTTPPAQPPSATPLTTATYRTFDGLVITVQSAKKNDKNWLKIGVAFDEQTNAANNAPAPATPTATGDPAAPEKKDEPAKSAGKSAEEVKKEVTELTDKLSKWAFAVPDYKAKAFVTRIDDLLKPAAPTQDTNPAGPGIPGQPAPETFPTPAQPGPIPTKPGG